MSIPKDRKMGVQQRTELVKIVTSTFEKRIKKAEQEMKEKLPAVTKKVRKQLGADKIEAEVIRCEKIIEEMKAKKEELGFSRYGNSVNGFHPSAALTAVGAELAEEESELNSLQRQLEDATKSLWTAATVSEAEAIMEGVLGQ